ncbi:glycoside hydrolase family 28 protein [Larkinella humicola]|uniref:Glycoside hydrolase n=1 Tax=Larkinella humicola TaxID=2607654 RepID=A0A5N1JGE6_9BACT|nr:glycosyl hydrolase family 28 protein [Larkinella humicola]KAA9354784.1 glycoside hydrolase [Larkinella humicola]
MIYLRTALLLLWASLSLQAKDYPASFFGIYSDGATLNTRSIQYAIDYIHSNGGGRLVFYVGRYLTGSIHLKSNVTLHLEEGAVLMGSLNPFDYDRHVWTALVFGENQQNIAITGKGVIDGQGRQLARNVVNVIQKGLVKDLFRYDRPEAEARAVIIYFKGCQRVKLQTVTLRNAASWVQIYDQCRNVQLAGITVDSKAYWNNDGIDIVDSDSVSVTDSYIDSADDGICLKSHDASQVCQNIYVRNCTIRSSANAIKFGTASYGGFRNIKMVQNKVYDTYRSAIALEAVDGGFIENVVIDSLQAINTGNAIFLRIGERVKGKKGRLENVRLTNIRVEVPATKPDAGYEYEGPIEDMPRNVSPSSIVGMPDAIVNDVTLKNVEIIYAGGGSSMVANVPLTALDKVPEKPTAYPDFSMFGELPAWGFYIRHAQNIRFDNVKLTCLKKDYRPAVVLDDVKQANLTPMLITDPDRKKPSVYSVHSTGLTLPGR